MEDSKAALFDALGCCRIKQFTNETDLCPLIHRKTASGTDDINRSEGAKDEPEIERTQLRFELLKGRRSPEDVLVA